MRGYKDSTRIALSRENGRYATHVYSSKRKRTREPKRSDPSGGWQPLLDASDTHGLRQLVAAGLARLA
jgi:hypothetical protein